MQCLEKNPDKRPQTARDLGEQLQQLSFEHAWTPERAELWWKRYDPTAVPAAAPASSGSGDPATKREPKKIDPHASPF
jgi:serine/threonine-protein kinase